MQRSKSRLSSSIRHEQTSGAVTNGAVPCLSRHGHLDKLPVGETESIGHEVTVGPPFFFSSSSLLKLKSRLCAQCFWLSQFHRKAGNGCVQEARVGVLGDEFTRSLYPHGCYGLKTSHATRNQADVLFSLGLKSIIRSWSSATTMHCFCSVAV